MLRELLLEVLSFIFLYPYLIPFIMATTRSLPTISRCFSCHQRVLSDFVALASLPVCTQSTRLLLRKRGAISSALRNYSETPTQEPSVTWRAEESKGSLPCNDLADDTTSNTPTADEKSPLPWYLQLQPSGQTTSPLLERQKLPDLPESSPTNLLPILEHLSIGIGLDDLTLLDLRELDPPPALGANLIMIYGTARSEKHLHVSADRFCRWLRSTYKLSPYADGLLGRNELKIKLRRKAKRAKLLGSARTSKGPEEDDGIRTGWVCVNVGSIEQGEGVERSLDGERITGFGGREDGSKLVVQMLTEERREELDLERLWSGFLRRQTKKEMKSAERDQNDSQVGMTNPYEVGCSTKAPTPVVTDAPSLINSSLNLAAAPLFHKRNFHSRGKALSNLRTTFTNDIHETTSSSTLDNGSRALGSIATYTNVDLRKHLMYLGQLPNKDAIIALGMGSDDHDSTSFLDSFYSSIPLFPKLEDWQARFELIFRAIEIGHPSYTTSCLINLLDEMHESLFTIPLSILERITNAIVHSELSNHTTMEHDGSDKLDYFNATIDLLEDMRLRSAFYFSAPIIEKLLVGFIRARRFGSNSSFRETAFRSFLTIIQIQKLFLNHASQHARILQELAQADNWDDYWHYWRCIPRSLQRRPQSLYAEMFRHVTESSHQARCFDAISAWIPEMSIEEPRVVISGDLAKSILECLQVANPTLEEEVHSGLNEHKQWVKLWRRCENGLATLPELLDKESASLVNGIYIEESRDGLE